MPWLVATNREVVARRHGVEPMPWPYELRPELGEAAPNTSNTKNYIITYLLGFLTPGIIKTIFHK